MERKERMNVFGGTTERFPGNMATVDVGANNLAKFKNAFVLSGESGRRRKTCTESVELTEPSICKVDNFSKRSESSSVFVRAVTSSDIYPVASQSGLYRTAKKYTPFHRPAHGLSESMSSMSVHRHAVIPSETGMLSGL